MRIVDLGEWRFFLGEDFDLGSDGVGKWMFFYGYEGVLFAEEMCRKAVEEGVVRQAKRYSVNAPGGSGSACFYVRADDADGHRDVLRFFLANDLIRRTKTGRLYNISFKLDEQTLHGNYGGSFTPAIRLADFVDLETGEFRD